MMTDVSQLFFSGFQKTLSHTECNPNRNFKLSLITLTTPGVHMSRKLAIYWKLSICVHTNGFHLKQSDISWQQVGSGTSTGTFLVEKGILSS